jgi:hypothetical protein
MSQSEQQLEAILDRLVRDVEASVHAMYRGDHRQNTMQVRSETHRKAARDALLPLIGGTPRGSTPAMSSAPLANGAMLGPDEIAAMTRCIMAWLPMGSPTDASPQSRCIAAAKELAPSWGEREKARLAAKRLSG